MVYAHDPSDCRHYSGQRVKAAALDVLEHRFGNFKGYGGMELEVMTLHLAGGGARVAVRDGSGVDGPHLLLPVLVD